MSKNKQPNFFDMIIKDTEELRKSIAKELNIKDPHNVTIEQLQAMDISTKIQPAIDWNQDNPPSPEELRLQEEGLMNEVDEELNENT